MQIKYGNGKTGYGPGVSINLTGDEVATAINQFLASRKINVKGPRTVTVNGDLCVNGHVYVDPSGSVGTLAWEFDGRGGDGCLPPAPPATATEFLNKANSIMTERAAQYDQPGGERSMGRAVGAFNTITGRDLTEAEGWLLLQVLKDVRQWQNPATFHRDSAEDSVAYAALKTEALARTAS